MERLRGRLVAIAVTTLAMHVAVVTLGAVRVCWASEHTHTGVAAEDCPMHHHGAKHSSQAAHDGSHAHGTSAVPVSDDGQQLACGCANDPTSPYVGPSGMLPPPAVLSHTEAPVLVSRQAAESPDDLRFPPLAPPPRSNISARS